MFPNLHHSLQQFRVISNPVEQSGEVSFRWTKFSLATLTSEHVCETCGRAFFLRHHLVSHVRLHTGEKPFACSFCEKRFTASGGLQRHERTHTGDRPRLIPFLTDSIGEKPYECPICSNRFSESGHLSRHIDSHKGKPLADCTFPQCKGRKFSPYHLSRHLTNEHSGLNPPCETEKE